MSDAGREVAVSALDQLCEALDAIGDSLVAVDHEAMLAAEPKLLAAMTALSTMPAADETLARARCDRATSALLRCRRLGASFSRAARVLSGAGTCGDAYDRSGAPVDCAGLRAVLRVRI